jgi:hypothetical protein
VCGRDERGDVRLSFWVVNTGAVVAFGVGAVGLLRPVRLLSVYRWTWARSAQLARSPAILDEVEARYVGAMFILAALILASAAAWYGFA